MTLLIGIIKIIGIIFLIIAAVVLLLIAAVLFVPLRYRIEGSFHEEQPCGRASVKWMLGILSFKASYNGEDGAKAYISLFGRCIYDLLGDDETGEADTAASSDEAPAPYEKTPEGDGISGVGNVSSEAAMPDMDAEASEKVRGDSAASVDDASAAHVTAYEGDKAPDNGSVSAEASEDVPGISVHGIGADRSKKHILSGIGAMRDRIFDKIRRTCDKASELIDAAERKLNELAAQAAELLKALKKAFDKRSGQLNDLVSLWNDERYQASKQLLISRIFRLLNEIRPRRGHGELRLGLGDPYGTGQAMQAAAFLYPLYGGVIDVIPDFDRSIIDGEAEIRGRIRLIIPAEAALRIFLDKGLKSMYKEARTILELD